MNSVDTVVSAMRVTKTFGKGGVTALQEIDLEVGRGEFISLIGPSGCGKSTLLRVIGDLVEPTTGEILVNGKSAHRARLDRDYGIVFQSAVLYDWRTVAKNIALPLELMGFDRATRASRVRELARMVELEGFEEPLSLAALGRHAAARVDRAGALLLACSAAHGRAVRGAGRDDARAAESGAPPDLERDSARR